MEQKSGSYKMDSVCTYVMYLYILLCFYGMKDSSNSVVLYNF